MPGGAAAQRKLEIVLTGDERNLAGSLDRADGAAGRFGGRLQGLGKIAVAGFAVVGGAALGAGAILLKMGGEWDSAVDTIRTSTGKTGEELKGLENDLKAVLSTTATDAETAGLAIAEVNKRVGASGKPLQGLAQQYLNLGKLAGEDVPGLIEGGSKAFASFGVAAKDQAAGLDQLFRISQAGGGTVGALQEQLTKFGPTLRGLGFDFGKSAALLGSFEKAGLNTNKVMAGLSKANAFATKEGKTLQQVWAETYNQLQKTSDPVKANALALEVFGSKAGPELAEAIRSGKLETMEMFDLLGSGDSIAKATADTEDFGEKWTKIKNRVFVALLPPATKLFDLLGKGMDALAPIVSEISAAFSSGGFSGALGMVGEKWAAAWPKIRSTLGSIGSSLWAWVSEQTPVVLGKLGELVGAAGNWIIGPGLDLFVEKATEWGDAFVKWVGPMIPPLLRELGKLGTKVAGWILTEAAPKIGVAALKMGAALISWVWRLAPDVLKGLGNLLVEIGKWEATGALKLVGMGARLGARLISGLWNAAKDKVGAFVGWVAGIPASIGHAFGEARKILFDVGVRILAGLWDGMVDKWHDLTGWLGGLGGKIVELKGPPARDSVLLVDNGRRIMRGLGDGMRSEFDVGVAPTLSAMGAQIAGRVGASSLAATGTDGGGARPSRTRESGGSTVVVQLVVDGSVVAERVVPHLRVIAQEDGIE